MLCSDLKKNFFKGTHGDHTCPHTSCPTHTHGQYIASWGTFSSSFQCVLNQTHVNPNAYSDPPLFLTLSCTWFSPFNTSLWGPSPSGYGMCHCWGWRAALHSLHPHPHQWSHISLWSKVTFQKWIPSVIFFCLNPFHNFHHSKEKHQNFTFSPTLAPWPQAPRDLAWPACWSVHNLLHFRPCKSPVHPSKDPAANPLPKASPEPCSSLSDPCSTCSPPSAAVSYLCSGPLLQQGGTGKCSLTPDTMRPLHCIPHSTWYKDTFISAPTSRWLVPRLPK